MLASGCGARSSLEAPAPPPPPPTPVLCDTVAGTPIYIVAYGLGDEGATLFSFDPPSATFRKIGDLDCPSEGMNPFSMAVDHEGKAYVLFQDGGLFLASTTSAECEATSYQPDTSTFTQLFGMGFSANAAWQGERLFVSSFFGSTPAELAYVDTSTFTVHPVAPFSYDIGDAELTGTSDGRLFGFGVSKNADSAHLVEIDPASATLESDISVSIGENPSGWAFAFWGGDFYVFTSSAFFLNVISPTTVTRVHPDGSIEQGYATLPGYIVMGAGVSVCAPH